MVPQLAALAGRGRSLLLGARAMRASGPGCGRAAVPRPAVGHGDVGDRRGRRRDGAWRQRPDRRPASRHSPPTARRGAPTTTRSTSSCWRPQRHRPRPCSPLPRRKQPACWRRWTMPASSSSPSPSPTGRIGWPAAAATSCPSRCNGPSPRRRSARRSGRTGARRTARCCASRSAATAWWSTTSTTTRSSIARSPRSADTSASTSNRRPCACRAGRAASRSTGRTTATGTPAVVAALPAGLVVTGASYGGIGIPACVAQAEATARQVASLLRV